MSAFSLGPLTISADQALMIIALLAALIAGRVAARGRETPIVDTLFSLALAGLVGARLVFVLRYWGGYAPSPVSIIDIRDGGFDAIGGLLGMAAYANYAIWRQPVLRRPLAAALVTGALVWGAAAGALHLTDTTPLTRPRAVLQTLAGQQITLDALAHDHAGAPMVVNLWASWCPPCRAEMPMLADAQNAHSEVIFVFANQGESRATIRDFLRHESLQLDNVLMDPGQRLSRAADARAFPTTLFFNAEGLLVDRHLGLLSRATLARGLDRFSPATDTRETEK